MGSERFVPLLAGFLRRAPATQDARAEIRPNPFIFGGSPTDPANETRVDRAEHTQLVRWWNALLRDISQPQRQPTRHAYERWNQ